MAKYATEEWLEENKLDENGKVIEEKTEEVEESARSLVLNKYYKQRDKESK